MPAPTSYTEATLRQYMVDELSTTGVALGLTVGSAAIVKAANDVERLLGVAIADATDMALLEAAAVWKAWLAAEAASTNDKEIKAGTAGLKLQERFENIQSRLARAETAWYVAQSASEAASGSGGVGFFFGVACGGRGR